MILLDGGMGVCHVAQLQGTGFGGSGAGFMEEHGFAARHILNSKL